MRKIDTTKDNKPTRVCAYCREDTLPGGSRETKALSTTVFIIERLEENIKGKLNTSVSLTVSSKILLWGLKRSREKKPYSNAVKKFPIIQERG